MGMNVKVNRVGITRKIRELAKIDFSNLTKKTSLIEVDEVEYARDKVETIDDYFQIYAGDGILRIKIKKGKNMFLRNFINQNIDNNFDFTVESSKGNVEIIIEEQSINDTNMENLIKLMYVHTML